MVYWNIRIKVDLTCQLFFAWTVINSRFQIFVDPVSLNNTPEASFLILLCRSSITNTNNSLTKKGLLSDPFFLLAYQQFKCGHGEFFYMWTCVLATDSLSPSVIPETADLTEGHKTPFSPFPPGWLWSAHSQSNVRAINQTGLLVIFFR